MRKFIIKFFLFFLPIAMLSYGADLFLSKHLMTSNSYADSEYPVWNDLYNRQINSDIVIYGASNAWIQIDPELISRLLNTSAYNLGINGHNFNLQYFRHRLLLEYNRKPKFIIQTISTASFEKLDDLYNPDQFLPYMLNNKEMEAATLGYNGYKVMDYHLPLIRYYGKKEAILHTLYLLLRPSTNHIVRIKGYKAKDRQWNTDFEKARSKMQSIEIKIDSSLVCLFENYIIECKQENIGIVFVNPPEYIEGQNFVKNRSAIMSLFYQFSNKYEIPFYDYSNDSISFQKKYFYNSGHLNEMGAELFTAKLIDDLKKNLRITNYF